LEAAFRKLIDRHESLRASFHLPGDQLEPIQKILPRARVEFEIEEYDYNKHGLEKTIRGFVRPFDLSRSPLLRVGLVQEINSRGKHILMIDMHHIITDGVSQAILRQEFMSLYANETLPGLRLRYKDFSEWSRENAQRVSIKKQEEYWLGKWQGEIPLLNLPTDYTRPPVQNFEGKRLRFSLDEKDTEALKKIAARENVTLFMIILAIYNVFLSKVSGQSDIVVGVPVAGRRHDDLERIIGMFVNTLAARNFPAPGKSWTTFLKEVKETTLEDFENQEYPFENLIEKLDVPRDMSRNPIFDVMLVLHNMEIGPAAYKPHKFARNISKFDLTLQAVESGEKLFFIFEYAAKLFKK
jgi:hypothetical protein